MINLNEALVDQQGKPKVVGTAMNIPIVLTPHIQQRIESRINNLKSYDSRFDYPFKKVLNDSINRVTQNISTIYQSEYFVCRYIYKIKVHKSNSDKFFRCNLEVGILYSLSQARVRTPNSKPTDEYKKIMKDYKLKLGDKFLTLDTGVISYSTRTNYRTFSDSNYPSVNRVIKDIEMTEEELSDLRDWINREATHGRIRGFRSRNNSNRD